MSDARLPAAIPPFGPLHCLIGPVYHLVINGRAPEGLAAAEVLETVVRAMGDRTTLGFVLNLRMYGLTAIGRHQEALSTGELLLTLHRENRSVVGEAKASADLAEVRIRMGRVEEGLRNLAWSLALLEDCRQNQRYLAAMSSVVEAARAAELYELADAAARSCVDSGFLTGTDRLAAELQHAELLVEWGMRLDHLGRREEAMARLGRSAELTSEVLAQASDTADAPLAKALLSLAVAKLGDTERAAGLAARLILPARQGGQFHEARLAHLAYGIALRARGDLAAARRELIAADDLAARSGEETVRQLYQHELALLAVAEVPAAAQDLRPLLRSHATQRWQARMERIWLLRSLRARADLEADRARANEAAVHDPLTGLGNRRRFEQQMSWLGGGEPGGHGPVSLVLIDADNFKTVNDRHSHGAGDQVLRQIAEILRTHCREQDVPVRFGGDEFAIFLRADRAGAAAVAERIRRATASMPGSPLSSTTRMTRLWLWD